MPVKMVSTTASESTTAYAACTDGSLNLKTVSVVIVSFRFRCSNENACDGASAAGQAMAGDGVINFIKAACYHERRDSASGALARGVF
jgi:hypothetical protein